jgi:hypothetical protein
VKYVATSEGLEPPVGIWSGAQQKLGLRGRQSTWLQLSKLWWYMHQLIRGAELSITYSRVLPTSTGREMSSPASGPCPDPHQSSLYHLILSKATLILSSHAVFTSSASRSKSYTHFSFSTMSLTYSAHVILLGVIILRFCMNKTNSVALSPRTNYTN